VDSYIALAIAQNSHKGVIRHGNSPDLRRHMSEAGINETYPIMSDLPNRQTCDFCPPLSFSDQARAVACLPVQQAIAAPRHSQDTLPTRIPLGIEFISQFRGCFGKSNIEFTCRPAKPPTVAVLRATLILRLSVQAESATICYVATNFNVLFFTQYS